MGFPFPVDLPTGLHGGLGPWHHSAGNNALGRDCTALRTACIVALAELTLVVFAAEKVKLNLPEDY
ncbi:MULTISPECIES: hypothetical protein [unclassified Synechocystis]|uniref:hypothetical protein n=1 Tax=unclassified Synechocystis TaxID=2640012 RepID=UPI0002FB9352|nr:MULTISPECIES: hypothetical protein [unclassified Synechocystis]MBD2618192.1 hypothetical protein [Synechocystis sp. FACHB-898]MBD2637521.1 hypothetical protein [Synechocystis sp. FACHB-908]MBD2660730.1 hypothetical protein [Synechocystis sp. FACHB-929]MCW5240682.1 hypothetical protein [Synechocystis sp. PCC 6803]NHL98467.1 hypothetical protein [Synechocystis sp. PCC 6803]